MLNGTYANWTTIWNVRLYRNSGRGFARVKLVWIPGGCVKAVPYSLFTVVIYLYRSFCHWLLIIPSSLGVWSFQGSYIYMFIVRMYPMFSSRHFLCVRRWCVKPIFCSDQNLFMSNNTTFQRNSRSKWMWFWISASSVGIQRYSIGRFSM